MKQEGRVFEMASPLGIIMNKGNFLVKHSPFVCVFICVEGR